MGTAAAFDAVKPRLFGLAYRMLGSRAEAEDVVQEAYIRWHQADEATVRNAEAWLVTTATRLAIDRLRALKVEREAYVGPWLPEPLIGSAPAPPDRNLELASDLSIAFLVLLERLSPVERAVLVLRDAFDLPFADIAAIVERSEDNCRQILSRARRRIEDDRPRFDADPAQRDRLAARFLAAAREGDLAGLVAVLAADAVLIGDGGGRARSIPRPMHGAPAIARALVVFYAQVEDWGLTLEPAHVNGQPGFRSLDSDGRVVNVVGLDIERGRVATIYSMLNPDKLGHLGPVSDVALRPSAR